MSRLVFPAILAMALAAPAAPAELGQLDASPTLFTVMAALNAAGYSAELSSPNNAPLRDAIRNELAKRNIPSLPAIKEFFSRHRQKNDVLELSQYVSFALTVSGPPGFTFKQRDVDIPPDVVAMKELAPLLAAFYKEAGIEDLWKQSQPAIEQYLELYHLPVSQAVLQVNGYLRQQTTGFKGRRFQIFVELLGEPNQIQTRSYGDDYTIVVTPSPEPRVFDVRHAYLHYLLDPLSTRYQEILDRKKGLSDHAQRAPALDDSFKQDFLLLTTESLIKAVEARLDHRPEGVQEALRQGYVLAPYFAEQLPVYEKQEQAMLFYYPTLVSAIDLVTEDARLSKVQFDKDAPVRAVKVAPPPPPPALTGAAKTLEDAEQFYSARDLENAKQAYLDVLQQAGNPALHAAAYYGLARIAALQKEPDVAERLFHKTLESQPDAQVNAWSLVYLGRLSMAAGDRAQAAQYFESALKVEGASPAAQQAATQGVESSKP
ncbi:MAG: tetratricopeptide repeat protein [Acidobacteriia bacterium]|nr:tetratricopeptide repeat protein [Terriglobia bacterium]